MLWLIHVFSDVNATSFPHQYALYIHTLMHIHIHFDQYLVLMWLLYLSGPSIMW